MLFVPFQELRAIQGTNRTSNSIGLGLACSRAIVRFLQGDIKLVESQSGFTKFSFKIPVTLRENQQ